MEKSNSFKRVVAGTLALLTVFGSAPASLQGVFAPTALVAEAANGEYVLDLVSVTNYITSVKIGDKQVVTAEQLGLMQSLTFGVTKETTVVVTSTAMLTFNNTDGNATEAYDSKTGVYTYTLKSGKAEGNFDANITAQGVGQKVVINDTVTGKVDAPDGTKDSVTYQYDNGSTNTTFASNGTVNIGAKTTIISKTPIAVTISDGDVTHETIAVPVTFNNNANQFEATFDMIQAAIKREDDLTDLDLHDGTERYEQVDINVSPITEEYFYTVSGGKLICNTKSGSITNATAASVSFTYFDKKQNKAIDVADGGSAPFSGSENADSAGVTAKFAIESKLATEVTDSAKLLSVTKDGVKFDDYTGNIKDGITFKRSGTYKVTYTVVGKDGKEYAVVGTVVIAPYADPKAEDLLLNLYGYDTSEGAPLASVDSQKDSRGVTGGVTTFMLHTGYVQTPYNLKVTFPQDWIDGGYLKDENDFKYEGYASGSKTDYEYTLTIKIFREELGGSAANPKIVNIKWKVVPYAATIKINHPTDGETYKGWSTYDNDLYIEERKVSKLEDMIYELLTANERNNGAMEVAPDYRNPTKAELSYEYVEGVGAAYYEDELDDRYPGLPSKAGVDENGEKYGKTYTVYVKLGDETVADVNVTIGPEDKKDIVELKATKEFNLTYGEKIEQDDFELQTVAYTNNDGVAFAGGKKVTDIKYSTTYAEIYKAVKNDKGEWVRATYADGSYIEVYDSYGYFLPLKYDSRLLDAGEYMIVFETQLRNEDKYTMWYQFDDTTKAPIDTYRTKDIHVTVAPKQITKDMITIDPVTYDGKTHDIVQEGAVEFYDKDIPEHGLFNNYGWNYMTGLEDKHYAYSKDHVDPEGSSSAEVYRSANFDKDNYNKYVQITEGPKRMDVGTYECTLKALDKNYTGTVDTNWSIAYTELPEGLTNVAVDFIDADTTIYDNGRLKLAAKRTANTKIENGYTVVEYGAIVDKAGVVPAIDSTGYTFEDTETNPYLNQKDTAEYTIAENRLVYTNTGVPTQKLADGTTNVDLGMTVKVSSADQGVWARTYVVVEKDGAKYVKYSEPRFLRLQEEAERLLQLKLALGDKGSLTEGVRRAQVTLDDGSFNLDDIKSGYQELTNKYYIYATFKDIDNSDSKYVLKPEDFGVIIDKNGGYFNDPFYSGVYGDYGIRTNRISTNNYTDEYLRYLWERHETYVDSLVKGGKGLITGHYDPNNKVLKTNEFGANITPSDSNTGVVVRMYVDLGNGLIVYTEPQKFDSVSDYYEEYNWQAVPTLGYGQARDSEGNYVWNNGNEKYAFTVAQTTKPEISYVEKKEPKTLDASKVSLVATGVVVDKKAATYSYVSNDELRRLAELNEFEDLYDSTLGMYKGVTKDLKQGTTGVLTGKKTDFVTNGSTYVGKATRVADKAMFVRAYATYNVNGTEVTVYGDTKEVTGYYDNDEVK